MMLTREQAAATWCPMVRTARHEVVHIEGAPVSGYVPLREEHHVVGGCNTASSPDRLRETSCVADRCAMWRWLGPIGAASSRLGYCGLAGAPVAQGGAA